MMVIFIVWILYVCLEQKILKSHKNLYEKKFFCNVVYVQYCKSDKA